MTKRQNNDLHVAKLRLDWASARIDDVESLVDSFLATHPCEVVPDVMRRGDSAHITYMLKVHHQPPSTIRFAAGDAIHNLRATLDNLVWGVGQAFRANNRLGLEFHESEDLFRNKYLPKISKLPDPIIEWITAIQPYHKQNYIILFKTLNQLWNRDKHRTPTIINTATTSGGLDFSGDRALFERVTFYQASGQKDQQKISTAIVPWDRRDEYNPKFSPLVAFSESGPVGLNMMGHSESIVEYLRHLHKYIHNNVIPKFEPFI